MPYLIAALVLVGAVTLVNLALTLGLARRMRQYTHLLSGLQPGDADGSTRPVGSAIPPFRATAVDGSAIDERWFDTPTLVGFFSPGCSACKNLLPDFVAASATRRTLAVVKDGDQPADDYLSALAEVAPVLVGDQAQQAIAAFGVHGYPSVCMVDADGVLSDSGQHLVHRRAAVDA